jgi:hypothetical protein
LVVAVAVVVVVDGVVLFQRKVACVRVSFSFDVVDGA